MLSFMRQHAAKILIVTVAFFVASIVVIGFQGGYRRAGSPLPRNLRNGFKHQGNVATVAGQEINSKNFLKNYNGMMMHFRDPQQKDPLDPKMNAEIQYLALKQTIEFEQILRLAKKMKVRVGRGEFNEQVKAIKNAYQLKSTRDFNNFLTKNGYPVKDFYNLVRDEIRVAKLINSIRSSIKVTDQDVKNQFKKVHARHILISADQKDAREQIAKIYDRLLKGEDFAKLATEYSMDPGSAKKGGDLGYFGPGMMVPEFEDQAFSLNKGSFSKPFETQYGYHIVKVEDVIAADIPIDVDEKELKNKLQDSKTKAAVNKLRLAAEQEFPAEIYLPLFKAFEAKSKGDFKQALGEFSLISSQSPQSPIPHIFVADIYEQLGDKKAALAEYQKGLLLEKLYPDNKTPFVHYYLGNFYNRQGQKGAARKELNIAEPLVKDDTRLLKNIQDEYKKAGALDAARLVGLRIMTIEKSRQMALATGNATEDIDFGRDKKTSTVTGAMEINPSAKSAKPKVGLNKLDLNI